MKVIVTRSALGDLQEIQAYYSDQGVPDTGNQLINAILDKVHNLCSHPDLGRKVPEFNQEHIREIIHPPYRVVYLRSEDAIHLVRVWRSERVLTLADEAGQNCLRAVKDKTDKD